MRINTKLANDITLHLQHRTKYNIVPAVKINKCNNFMLGAALIFHFLSLD